jgi:predicted nicotinamide N-methyase
VAGTELRVQQLKQGELSGLGTGATVWPAAHVLSKYLERRYPLSAGGMRGLKVMDLGSGTGVAGLAAALLGADSVVVTDQAQLHFLMEENVARADTAAAATAASISVTRPPQQGDAEMKQKSLRERVIVCTYDWGGAVEHFKDNLPFDVVLVSDCVLPKLYPIEPLVAALCDITKPLAQPIDGSSPGEDKSSGKTAFSMTGDVSGPVILMSYEHRTYPSFDPRVKFEELATEAGLVKHKIPLAEHDLLYRADDIELWEVRRCDDSSDRGIENGSNEKNIVGKGKPNPKDVWTSADGWGDVQFRSVAPEIGSRASPGSAANAAVSQPVPQCEVRVGWHGSNKLPLVNLALDEAGGRVSGDLWASALAMVGYLHERYNLSLAAKVLDSPSPSLPVYDGETTVTPPLTPGMTTTENHSGNIGGHGGVASESQGLAGLRVLELGSGVGLAAVVAKRLGASQVVATDKADALSLLVANLDLNFGANSCGTSSSTTATATGLAAVDYDWVQAPPPSLRPPPTGGINSSPSGSAGQSNDAIAASSSSEPATAENSASISAANNDGTAGGSWDLVLCADCCYASPSVQPLLKSLLEVVTPGHTQVYCRPKTISKETLTRQPGCNT